MHLHYEEGPQNEKKSIQLTLQANIRLLYLPFCFHVSERFEKLAGPSCPSRRIYQQLLMAAVFENKYCVNMQPNIIGTVCFDRHNLP